MFNIFNKYSRFIYFLIVVVIITVLIFLYAQPYFVENDDVVMLLIASGKYSGNLDNHLVFINSIYGSLLNLFYFALPSLEWYTIFFIVINIVSISMIAYIYSKLNVKTIYKVVFLLLLAAIYYEITINLQFTKTAAIVAISGIILIYYSTLKYKKIGVVLFVLGALIRFEATFLCFLVTGAIFLEDFLKTKKISITPRIKLMFLAVIISLGVKLVDKAYYSLDSNWESYSKYNKIRGEVNDNPNDRMLLYNLPNGISKTEYESILTFFINPKLIDIDKLKKIDSVLKNINPFTKIRNIYRLHYYKKPFLFLFLTFLVIGYFNKNKTLFDKIILIKLAVFFILVLYLALNANVKYRVFFSAIVSILLLYPFLLKEDDSVSKKLILSITAGYFLFYFFNVTTGTNKDKKYLNLVFEEQKSIVNNYFENFDNKIVVFGGDYILENENPLIISENYNGNFFFSGWLTGIPFHKNKFDSFKFFVNNYKLFVLQNHYSQAVEQVVKSVKKECNIEVVPKIVTQKYNYIIVEFIQ